MQIKRLRLSGFKSFVDPADLRIEPGLTGIVGPNGCGKSNLLEALRWAMGENSPKSMRGAGMEDVIFAGTATRPQRDFAEVSILTDEMGDEGEVEIVRRIERGAGSAYRINGRDVRAKDVSLAFADAATGAHSPALVSQGRIGAIISAKPAERRAMLEEAAGIAGLHVRRKDAEQKLRATETNLARLDEVITDQETRAQALRWAMGENSPKSMRGAGMEDVIFAGTATRPQREFAEVSILADQVADVGTGQHEELEVVRRIERGAGSAYRINGRDVRAKDVSLAFADAATGAHSPALVSQGRIGAIIAARPAERRAMLEEAAGIAGLHVRRK
ncbi:MAG: AAA family ATPase, partial [Sphingomonas sp.]